MNHSIDSFHWDRAEPALRLALTENRAFRNGTYDLLTVDQLGFTLRRRATGSTVRVTRSMFQKTLQRFYCGEMIPRRSISYTVAIEYGVLLAFHLGGYEIWEDSGYYHLGGCVYECTGSRRWTPEEP